MLPVSVWKGEEREENCSDFLIYQAYSGVLCCGGSAAEMWAEWESLQTMCSHLL